jgi:predicted O-methyltransferase YrrM
VKLSTNSDIYMCLQAYTDSAALGAAMELGLFWLLAERPLTAPGVAQALSIPPTRCGLWLQLLEGMGLIDQGPDGYVPSSVARTAILDRYSQDTWAYLAEGEREQFRAACDLALHIQEPGPIKAAQEQTTLSYWEKLVHSPERARRFTNMLYEVHQALAAQVAEHLDMGGVRRMMDLGGNSGVVSLALLRRYPDLTSVIVDIENVCIAGRETVARNGAADCITFHAADFVRDELPGGFDLVLQCDVGVYSQDLYHKLWLALNRGGRLVIVDHFAPAEDVATPALLYWGFLDSLVDPDLRMVTAEQVGSWLVEADFHLLSEETLPGGRLVIQACKH